MFKVILGLGLKGEFKYYLRISNQLIKHLSILQIKMAIINVKDALMTALKKNPISTDRLILNHELCKHLKLSSQLKY